MAYSGEALVLEDAAGHETVGPFAERYGIRSVVAVPLLAREQTLGVLLLVERRAARHFEPAEVDFARRLGTSIGLALENARLFSDSLETSRHLTNVLRGMTDGFVSVDRGVALHAGNPQAEQLIGRPAAELLGKSMEALFPDMEGWSHYRTVMSERRPETFEVWSKPLASWLEVHAYPTGDGVSILFSDITALRAAAEELRLHNADLAERAHFADSLNAINRLLHATLDFGHDHAGCPDQGVEALAAAAALIEMREESQWVVRCQSGLSEAEVGLRLGALRHRSRPASRSAVSRLLSRSSGCRRRRRVCWHLRTTFSAGVPLLARGAVTGCLLFYDKKVRVFTDAEIDFGRKLGATVSLALRTPDSTTSSSASPRPSRRTSSTSCPRSQASSSALCHGRPTSPSSWAATSAMCSWSTTRTSWCSSVTSPARACAPQA